MPLPQPIKARAHGLIDYGFGAAALALPAALGLSGRTRALAGVLAATQGSVNALTATRVGVRPVLSLRTHGWIEAASLPPFLAVPFLTGAASGGRERAFWVGLGVALATVYALTDWQADAAS